MLTRILALLLAFSFAGLTQSNAAGPDDRLRKLLEEKFGKISKPEAPDRAKKTVPQPAAEDLYVVKPDGSVEKVTPLSDDDTPKTKPQEDDNSFLPVQAPRKAQMFALGMGTRAPAHQSALKNMIVKTGVSGRYVSEPAPLAKKIKSTIAKAMDKKPSMVVNRKIIVIQLKRNVTGEQIDELIRKYKLKVVKHVPFLGALYCEISEPELTGTDTPKKETIGTLLEPKIVLQLRAEEAVNAAFVSTTISPKTIPRTSGTKVNRNGEIVQWNWSTDSRNDGNWGLKSMRMPPVWSILSRVQKGNLKPSNTRIAILDTGFGTHPQLTYQNIKGAMPPQPIPADCARSHGTHVAGIIAASQDAMSGIDGIVPNAKIDPIPISRQLVTESAIAGSGQAQQHLSFFANAITDLGTYFEDFPLKPDERVVVNVSLAYNWSWVAQIAKEDPTTDRVIRDQIRQHANFLQFFVDRVSDQVIFVAAAGNDSLPGEQPFAAELATPFAFIAKYRSAGFTPSNNVIVVEAHDRDDERASFSNVGGHVSAPGVDVLSTLASDTKPYGACSGTSQAAPHVAALAAILLELEPTKSPAQIVNLITNSAIPGTKDGGAPRVDALAAILSLSKQNLTYLADLNSDSKVDSSDLKIFKSKLIAIEGGRFGERISEDLNGDGVVNEYERCWPLIDLNGSGRASYDPNDARLIAGTMMSDLEVLKAAWSDPIKRYAVALRETRLDELINVWRSTALVAAVPRLGKKPPCN